MRNSMKIAVYVKNKTLCNDKRFSDLLLALKNMPCEFYSIENREDITIDTDILISVGGDGTFLSAAKRAAEKGVPVLGVNLGRLGFLSENKPENVILPLLKHQYEIEERTLLGIDVIGENFVPPVGYWHYALNEITVHRVGAAMLGVDVALDGLLLPTYWADGLLVATSTGSTAYSLSTGGPICSPEAKVLIIAPISPHNLNVRPLIVPETTNIEISLRARDKEVMLTMDNRNMLVTPELKLNISKAPFSLKRIRLAKTDFVNALTTKLFWGEDVRNSVE